MHEASQSQDLRTEILDGPYDYEHRYNLDLALERLFLRQLVSALENFNRWQLLMLKKPASLTGETWERPGRRNDYAALQRERIAWETEARELTARVTRQLEQLLEIGFFVEKEWSALLDGYAGKSKEKTAHRTTVFA